MKLVICLIKNARVYNSYTKTFNNVDVTVKDGNFYWIGVNLPDIVAERTIDLKGFSIIPGLVDAHMHIESSMATPTNFGRAAVKFGTTTVIADAHEIANVAGINGLSEFMRQPSCISVFYAIPSSVPSTTPAMETTGGIIGQDEVATLLNDPKIICLGEAMNFKGITSQPQSLIRKIIKDCRNIRPTMPLEGHAPKVSGKDLADFINSGITSDHTFQTPSSLIEKITNGMFIEIQQKSLSTEIVKTIIEHQFYEHVALVTDDVMADDLRSGHLNRLVEQTIKFGMAPEEAIYLATYTPARRMGLWDRGSIAPGRIADFVVLSDVDNFVIEDVFLHGNAVTDIVAPDANEGSSFDSTIADSVHVPVLTESDLLIKTAMQRDEVAVNTVQISATGTFTKRGQVSLPVINGQVQWQENNLSLLMVQNRYSGHGELAFGFVENGVKGHGAIGATWAHDHHNLMIMGTDIPSMLAAHQQLVDDHGGYVVAENGLITANTPLPIGGIISSESIDELGAKLATVRQSMRRLGYQNSNEIMSFSTLSLLVSPAIKISDKGLFDVKTQQSIPMFVK
ncbi:adenine deaminase C-terminal domain-containing protein [Furfurilactobacillus cerevisiae]|uniref:adenine deaminase C-terminal domain-containing protein n=1 Tax=Furfurilactobacillus rossiae TaxID=231049 RepID=UPI003B984157